MRRLTGAVARFVIYCFLLCECYASNTRDPTPSPSVQLTHNPTPSTSAPSSQPTRFCSVCAPGEFYNTKLAAGSANSVVGCTSCFPGYTCEGGCDDPVACDPGTYNSQYRASTCTDCSAGSYNMLTAAISCKICPAGYACNSTIAGEKQCLSVINQAMK